jgi:hypothetical protein
MLLKIITGIEYMEIIWAVNTHCTDYYRFSAAHVRDQKMEKEALVFGNSLAYEVKQATAGNNTDHCG